MGTGEIKEFGPPKQHSAPVRRPSNVAVLALIVLISLCVTSLAPSSSPATSSRGSGIESQRIDLTDLVARASMPLHRVENWITSPDCQVADAALAIVPTAYSTNATDIFSQLCVEPPFDQTLSAWGGLYQYTPPNSSTPAWAASNFSVEVSWTTGTSPVIYFVIGWTANCSGTAPALGSGYCSFQEYWAGYVSNDTIVGPATEARPLTMTADQRPAQGIPEIDYLFVGGASAAVLAAAACILAWRYRSESRFSRETEASIVDSDARRGDNSAVQESDSAGSQDARRTEDAEGSDPLHDVF
jgi:hypothetical protein